MERVIGTRAMGLRTPIITEGDDIVQIIVNTLIKASKVEGFTINDRDIITVTESVVARAQGNYALLSDVTADLLKTFADSETIGVVFPIFSRNRFALILQAIAQTKKKIVLMLNYPSDEVGNHLIDLEKVDKQNINPWADVLTESQFRENFGSSRHPFTGIDYIEFYKSILSEHNSESEIIFSNIPTTILSYTKDVIFADVHTRTRTKRILQSNGGRTIIGLADILNTQNEAHGYNEEYGLLGSNKATDEKLKLFPRDCQAIVDAVQAQVKERTGKTIEVMVYGDGAFKDPVGGIWELADPVVSPAFTTGLAGTPNEVKLKYLADKDFAELKGDDLKNAVTTYLKDRDNANEKGQSHELKDEASQGTTPRRITDLLGSLSDLTSGSGDKGTPVVFIQGYFDNYAK